MPVALSAGGPGDAAPGIEVAHHPLFAGVPAGMLPPLIDACQQRRLPPNAVLLEPGQENRFLYLLLAGGLRVGIDDAVPRAGFTIAPGEFVGEISIIDQQPATASVVSVGESRVLAIPERVLWVEMFAIPAIARNFMRLCAARFRERHGAMQQARVEQLRWQHLQRELAIARDIQCGMLPAVQTVTRHFKALDLGARMTPANEVGGDFYDAIPLDDRNLCIAIGDVSGKGIAASLFMMRVVSLLRAEMLRHGDPVATVRFLNEALCSDNPRFLFASLIVGVFDTASREFRFVNAGHPPPLLGHAGSYRAEASATGLVVGVDAGTAYEAGTLSLVSGDKLLLYSDGVTEAMNAGNRQFSEDRLMAVLAETTASDAEATIDAVEAAVATHVAGHAQSDDRTMVLLRPLA